MVNSKRVIFVVISLLAVALIYSSSFIVRVFAEAPSQSWKDSTDCTSRQDRDNPNITIKRCCWYQYPRIVCQTCLSSAGMTTCSPVEKRPTTPQDITNFPQGGGVLEQPQKHPKHGGTVLPKGGGVLQQQDQGTTQTDDNKRSVKPSDGGGSLELPQTWGINS